MEFETLENSAMPGVHNNMPMANPQMPQQQAPIQSNQSAPKAPRKPKPGAMTNKPNIEALTGEQKPDQQDEM